MKSISYFSVYKIRFLNYTFPYSSIHNSSNFLVFYFINSGVGNAKVVVKAEKTTMTATATGVKKITVKFSEAVDTSKLKIVVKKGSATPTIDAVNVVDSSTVEVAMGANLTSGTYDIVASEVADADLTASITVEDEKLTSFAVSKNLIELQHVTGGNSAAVFTYKALNQYEEMMTPAGSVTVNCTFGNVTSTAISGKTTRTATAKAAGQVVVADIPDILAIQNQTGTVVLVDSKTGVSTNVEISYSAAAAVSSLELAGFYNVNSAKFTDISNNDSLGAASSYGQKYALLFKAYDQYDNELSASDINTIATLSTSSKSQMTVSVASGLTNIVASACLQSDNVWDDYASFNVQGTEYVGLLIGPGVGGTTAKTGTVTFTFVSSIKGLLTTQSYDVKEGTVIKSFAIDSTEAYSNEDNELAYTALDQNGNAVTDYAFLSENVDARDSNGTVLVWKKKADGSAKLMYKPVFTGSDNDNERETQMFYIQIQCNTKNVATNLVFQQDSITVREDRKIKTVAGISKDAVLAGNANTTVKIRLKDLVFADQFSNEINKDSDSWNKVVSGSVFYKIKDTNIVTASAVAASMGAVGFNNATDGDYIAVTPNAIGSTDVYLRYGAPATSDRYDYKVVVSCVDSTDAGAGDFQIKSINDGNVVKAVSNQAITVASLGAIDVVGKIGGANVSLQSTQWHVKSLTADKITTKDVEDGIKKKTGTLVIVVDTFDGTKEIVSEISATFDYALLSENGIAKLEKVTGHSATSSAIVASAAGFLDANDFIQAFKRSNQFGENEATATETNVTGISDVKYTAVVVDAVSTNGDIKKVKSSGSTTNACKLDLNNGDTGFTTNDYVQVEITATKGDITATSTVWYKLK